jgi:DNA-binding transcriptional regulator YiaG
MRYHRPNGRPFGRSRQAVPRGLYTMRGDNVCRIISARRASRRERAAYTSQTGARSQTWKPDRLGSAEADVGQGNRADSPRRSGAQPLSDERLARGFRPRALTALRKRLGLSQAEFARLFALNLRTLQDWEQGRCEPEEIARIYLRVIERNPDAVKAALED